MKKTKIILLITIILLISLSQSIFALEDKETKIKNETIRISPLIEGCENTTKVFKIERLNYSEGNKKLIVKYEEKLKLNNKSIIQENFSKTINKYSSSKTGKYFINESGKVSLEIKLFDDEEDKIIRWVFEINCSKIKNEQTNNTNNTNNITNTTNTTNQTNNNTNNTNNTNNNTNTTNNTTNTTNTTNQTNNETKEIICPRYFYIETNNELFEEGDKLLVNFKTDYWPEDFEIKYNIETIDGKTIKKEYTTKNNRTKTYTFKSIKTKEQADMIKAQIKSPNCETKKTRKLIVQINNEEEPEKTQPEINIEGKLKEKTLKLYVDAKRGESSKTTIKIKAKDDNGRQIIPEQKIILKNKYSQTKNIYEIKIEKILKRINIEVEGFGITKTEEIINEETIETKEKINNETKEKKEKTNNKTKEEQREEIKNKNLEKNINKTNKTKQTEIKQINNTKIYLNKNQITGKTIKNNKELISENTTKIKTTRNILIPLVLAGTIFLIIKQQKIKIRK